MVKLSVLDLCPIVEGGDAAQAFAGALDLARHAEQLGYGRYWLAEHHNMLGVASSATAVMICRIAAATTRIRVGAGGVMLPNHAPLIVAEQFGALACLFPGRIDLGLGRTPGGNPATARAIRRNLTGASDTFPKDVLELQTYFRPANPGQAVQAVPGAGLDVPLWILGSSNFGAQLAAHLGLPFAFAAHLAPAALESAASLYRTGFKPSAQLAAPYLMLTVNGIAAATDAEARLLFTSLQQDVVNLRAGRALPLAPPVEDYAERLDPAPRASMDATLAYALVGSAGAVRAQMLALVEQTGADELMISGPVFDHAARRESFSILAEAANLSG